MNYLKILILTLGLITLGCNNSNFSADGRGERNIGGSLPAIPEQPNIDNEFSPLCNGDISIALLMDTSLSMTFPPVGGNSQSNQ